jgi:hypothetical protein
VRRTRRTVILLAALALVSTGLVFSGAPALAATGGIHASGVQELDGSIDYTGNTQAYRTTTHDTALETAMPYDWSSLFTGCTSATGTCATSHGVTSDNGPISRNGAICQPGSCSGLISDVGLPYTGDLFTQGSKDVNDVTSWTCTQQSTPPKDQLVNTYAAAWTAPANAGAVQSGDTLAFMGLERPSTNGNSNAGFWLFKKAVLCDPASGDFVDGDGNLAKHSNGDLFLVGSFLSGGSNAVLNKYTWDCTPVSSTDPTCAGSGSLSAPTNGQLNCPDITVSTDTFCQVTNQQSDTQVVRGKTTNVLTNWTVKTPWSNLATGSDGIPGPGFLEMGIDLSQALNTPGAPAPCFASFLVDTRSSGSSSQAETKNFINGSFPTCGDLNVKKYIDADLDPNGATGDIAVGPHGTDVTSGAVVAGWNIAVAKGATNLCTGTTDTTGTLSCASGSGLTNIPNGTALTVTETVPAAAPANVAPAPATAPSPGFFNTDPGVVPASGSVSSLVGTTVTKNVTMGTTDKTVYVGNECFVNTKFELSGVPNTSPTATKSVRVSWTVNSGNYNGSSSTGTIDLSPTSTGSSTWNGVVKNTFVQNDSISWTWHSVDFSDSTSSEQTGGSNVSLSAGGYPTCAASTSSSFASPTVSGVKYKDANHDASRDAYTNPIDGTKSFALEPLLGGFTMSLYPNGTCTGTALATTTTSSTALTDGINNYTFGTRAPGGYSVKETVLTGWRQTAPVVSSAVQACVPVTVTLGHTTDSPAAIGNTPLSNIGASFTSLTGATNSKISCTTSDGGGDTLPSSSTSGSYSGNNVEDGTYTCTIIVADP